MRCSALVLVLGLTSLAHASFDVLLVADNGSNTFQTRSIKRFDPVTGAYLGQFGSSTSDFKSMVVVPTRKQLYVSTTGNGVLVYDYNTGDLVNQFSNISPLTSMRMNAAGTGLIITVGTNTIYSADLDMTSFPFLVTRTGSSFYDAVQVSNGGLAAYDGAANLIRTYTSANVDSGSTVSIASTATVRSLTGTGYGSTGFGYIMNYTTGQTYYSSMSLNSSGGFSFLGSSTSAVSTNWLAAAPAHVGGYALGQTSTAGIDEVVRFAPSGAIAGYWTTSALVNPVAMTTYLAPEPGTWAALGLGALAVLRRRRTR